MAPGIAAAGDALVVEQPPDRQRDERCGRQPGKRGLPADAQPAERDLVRVGRHRPTILAQPRVASGPCRLRRLRSRASSPACANCRRLRAARLRPRARPRRGALPLRRRPPDRLRAPTPSGRGAVRGQRADVGGRPGGGAPAPGAADGGGAGRGLGRATWRSCFGSTARRSPTPTPRGAVARSRRRADGASTGARPPPCSRAAGGRLGGAGGLLERLAAFEAYAIRWRRRRSCSRRSASAAAGSRSRDPENWEVSADNVLMRLALRSGLVEPGDARPSPRRDPRRVQAGRRSGRDLAAAARRHALGARPRRPRPARRRGRRPARARRATRARPGTERRSTWRDGFSAKKKNQTHSATSASSERDDQQRLERAAHAPPPVRLLLVGLERARGPR